MHGQLVAGRRDDRDQGLARVGFRSVEHCVSLRSGLSPVRAQQACNSRDALTNSPSPSARCGRAGCPSKGGAPRRQQPDRAAQGDGQFAASVRVDRHGHCGGHAECDLDEHGRLVAGRCVGHVDVGQVPDPGHDRAGRTRAMPAGRTPWPPRLPELFWKPLDRGCTPHFVELAFDARRSSPGGSHARRAANCP